jgi:hypothetical protein
MPVFPLTGDVYDYWKLPLQAIKIDNYTLPLSSSKIDESQTPIAVLDSGTTLILGPTVDVKNFWSAVGAARQGSDGQWQVQCTRVVAVTFMLGDETTKREYVMDPADISWDQERTDGWCYGGIQPNDDVRILPGSWMPLFSLCCSGQLG